MATIGQALLLIVGWAFFLALPYILVQKLVFKEKIERLTTIASAIISATGLTIIVITAWSIAASP